MMGNLISKEKFTKILFDAWWFVISVIMLIYPALQNGYPLLHADSGTYIYVGFLDYIPVSRPITYCWLVRHISLYYSLWLVIIFQGILMASFINLLISRLIGRNRSFFLSFVLIAILSTLTALPIYVCHIMPDIYLAIALTGYFIILTDKSMHWAWLVLISFISLYSTIVHFSNLPLMTAIVAALIILSFILKRYRIIRIYTNRIKIVVIILLLSWLSIPTINVIYGAGFGYSRVSNIVFTARLIMPGIFSDYVNERCETDTGFFLCEFKNSLPNYDRYHYFLWHDTSFLYQKNCEGIEGFADCWLAQDSLYGTVNSEIMKIAMYRNRFIADAFKQFGKQLYTFHLGTNPPYGIKSHINYPIKTYFPGEHDQYLSAHQQRSEIRYTARNTIQQITVPVSLLIILMFFFRPKLRKHVDIHFTGFFTFFILIILANAGLISVLSIVVGRFEGRLIWLLPAMAFVLAARYLLAQQKNEEEASGARNE